MAEKAPANPGAGKGPGKRATRKVPAGKAPAPSKKTRHYKTDTAMATANFRIKKVRKVGGKTRRAKLGSKLIKSINLIINLIITLAAALRQIRFFQKETGFLIPKLPFQRLVREICKDQGIIPNCRWQIHALGAVQEAVESFLAREFENIILPILNLRFKIIN